LITPCLNCGRVLLSGQKHGDAVKQTGCTFY
jgi:hypothetical protein